MILLQADLSQVESRIALAYTGDPAMLEIARAHPAEYDQHKRNAALIFGCSEDEVSKDMRYLGKKAVHAAQRGARGKKLSEELLKDGYRKTPQECDALIDTYLAHHAALEVFFSDVREQIINHRCLTNTWGRVIRYDYATINEDLFREGYSFKLQSEASDLLLQWGLIPTWRHINFEAVGRPRMHVPVHDSLLISTPPEAAYHLAYFIRRNIERPRCYHGNSLTVPVEFALGYNWAMQHEFKKLPSEREFTEAAYDCERRGKGRDEDQRRVDGRVERGRRRRGVCGGAN